jgi:hypothetical protein
VFLYQNLKQIIRFSFIFDLFLLEEREGKIKIKKDFNDNNKIIKMTSLDNSQCC